MPSDASPRLFLITPVFTGAPADRDMLTAALEPGEIACVLLRHDRRDERSAKKLLKELGPMIQAAGAALLVENDPRVAAHVDADGVQVAGPGEALESAIARLKPERIVGCGDLASRDDAMLAGEGDVDYLMFGEPGPDGAPPDPAWTLERVAWWAEIFNVPCVGFAQTLEAVEALAAAGAEFVAVADAVFGDPRGPAPAVRDALAALARAEASATVS